MWYSSLPARFLKVVVREDARRRSAFLPRPFISFPIKCIRDARTIARAEGGGWYQFSPSQYASSFPCSGGANLPLAGPGSLVRTQSIRSMMMLTMVLLSYCQLWRTRFYVSFVPVESGITRNREAGLEHRGLVQGTAITER